MPFIEKSKEHAVEELQSVDQEGGRKPKKSK